MNVQDVIDFLVVETGKTEGSIRNMLETNISELISTCIGVSCDEAELDNEGSVDYNDSRCSKAEYAVSVLAELHQASIASPRPSNARVAVAV